MKKTLRMSLFVLLRPSGGIRSASALLVIITIFYFKSAGQTRATARTASCSGPSSVLAAATLASWWNSSCVSADCRIPKGPWCLGDTLGFRRTLSTPTSAETMLDIYTADWPDNMTIDSRWICDLWRLPITQGSVRFIVTYDGSKDDYDQVLRSRIPVRNAAVRDMRDELLRRSLPERSTRFLHETPGGPVDGGNRESLPTEPNLRALQFFRTYFRQQQVSFMATWTHGGGRANDLETSASAFPWRKGTWFLYLTIEWLDKWMEGDMRRFLELVDEDHSIPRAASQGQDTGSCGEEIWPATAEGVWVIWGIVFACWEVW
ncbi:hypothetical protein QBC35DRAFT_455475 [Podospora australis]|uniref:Uncharacterized protein n=1 Tax=Podospora australis TaxID=1536484 RepID=A0AAN6WPX9_9PEZI|nr:hypothetical protein QBC35DRAFT_455475 [Podospora australis]